MLVREKKASGASGILVFVVREFTQWSMFTSRDDHEYDMQGQRAATPV